MTAENTNSEDARAYGSLGSQPSQASPVTVNRRRRMRSERTREARRQIDYLLDKYVFLSDRLPSRLTPHYMDSADSVQDVMDRMRERGWSWFGCTSSGGWESLFFPENYPDADPVSGQGLVKASGQTLAEAVYMSALIAMSGIRKDAILDYLDSY